MKKAFSISMAMVGTMIGAGYASGQEIAAFFGADPGIFVPVFCGLLFFAFSTVLLLIGSKLKTDSVSVASAALFGKAGGAADIIMLFNALIVLAAMLSGMDNAVYFLTGVQLPYGIITGLICAYILRFKKGFLNTNAVVVPLIVIFLAVTCLTAPLTASVTVSIPIIFSCFTYVSMNLLLSAGILVRMSGLSIKQILFSSLISSVIVAALMALIAAALPSATDTTMPLISVAKSGVIYYLFLISLIIAVFTTLLSALATLRSWSDAMFKDGDSGALIALIAAGVIGIFGFETVVNIFYPIIGVIGLVYIAFGIAYLVRSSATYKNLFKKRSRDINKRSQDVKQLY